MTLFYWVNLLGLKRKKKGSGFGVREKARCLAGSLADPCVLETANSINTGRQAAPLNLCDAMIVPFRFLLPQKKSPRRYIGTGRGLFLIPKRAQALLDTQLCMLLFLTYPAADFKA